MRTVLITSWVSLFSVVLPGCCFAQAERELIGLIKWHSSFIEHDQPARVESSMRLDSDVRRPVRLHSQLVLQSEKVTCPFLHPHILRHR